MIDITVYAKEIEKGLNSILKATDLFGKYEFSVLSDHRRYKKAKRRGNNIIYYINAVMTAAPNANGTTGDGLELVVENFTIDFTVPVERERAETKEDPQSVDSDGVSVFVELIKAIVNEYFSLNTATSYTVGEKRYAVGFEYTMSRTGECRVEPIIGEFIPFTVYVRVNLVQNGINSKDISLELDGEKIPYQMLVPNRASEKSIAVYSDKPTAAGTLMTSTTLAFDVSLPATTGTVTEQFNDFLTSGKANVVHFIRYKMGTEISRYYLMTFGDVSAQVEGVKSVGLTMPLVEAAFVPALLDFAPYVQVIPVSFPDLEDMTVSFCAKTDCIIAFGREDIADFTASDSVYNHTFSEGEVFLNDVGTYTAYIIACPKDKSVEDVVSISTEE